MTKDTLLHPLYFGNIATFVAIVQADSLCFEHCDHYQKQTYRNRTYIYGANGKLLLSIPVKHTHVPIRQLYRDIEIANDTNWQSQHWKSIQTAYRTSPFFEFYEAEFISLFQKPKRFLLDFNYECLQVIFDCMTFEASYKKTRKYSKTVEPTKVNDQRRLAISKKEQHFSFSPYTQVFSHKHGFLPNLSILDLLFNEGTNTLQYLENQITIS